MLCDSVIIDGMRPIEKSFDVSGMERIRFNATARGNNWGIVLIVNGKATE